MTRKLPAILAVSAALLLHLAVPAVAADPDDLPPGFPPILGPIVQEPSVVPCDPTAGAGQLIAGPQGSGGADNHLTRYGVCGHQLHNDLQGGLKDGIKRAQQWLAETLFSFGGWAIVAAATVHRWSAELSLTSMLSPVAADVTNALRPLYYAILTIGVVLGAFSTLMRAWGGRLGEMFRWLGFTAAAAGLAAVYLASPTSVIRGPNEVVGTVRASLMTAAAKATPASPYAPYGGTLIGTIPPANPDRWLIDRFEDQIGDVYLFQPWKAIQFGTRDIPDGLAKEFLAASAYTRDELAAIRANPSAAQAINQAHEDRFDAAKQTLEQNYPVAANYFRGDHAASQVLTAAWSAFSAVVAAVFHGLLGLAVLGAEALSMMVWVFALLVLALAPFGGWGQRVVRAFGGKLLGLLAIQVVLTAFQVLDLLLTSAILSMTSVVGGYFMAVLLTILSAVMLWKAIRPTLATLSAGDVQLNRVNLADRIQTKAKEVTGWVASKAAIAGGVLAGNHLLRRHREPDDQPPPEQVPAPPRGDSSSFYRLAPDPNEVPRAPDTLDRGSRPTAAHQPPPDATMLPIVPKPESVWDAYARGEDPEPVGEWSGTLPRPATLPFGASHADPPRDDQVDLHLDSPQPDRLTVDVHEPPRELEVDWRFHRPPADPTGMPSWPAPLDGDSRFDPDLRAAHDEARARALQEWRDAQDTYRRHNPED